jgi:hypothetical protein
MAAAGGVLDLITETPGRKVYEFIGDANNVLDTTTYTAKPGFLASLATAFETYRPTITSHNPLDASRILDIRIVFEGQTQTLARNKNTSVSPNIYINFEEGVSPYVEFNNFNPDVIQEIIMLFEKAVATAQNSSQGGGARRSTRRRRRSTKKKVASKKRKQTRRRA